MPKYVRDKVLEAEIAHEIAHLLNEYEKRTGCTPDYVGVSLSSVGYEGRYPKWTIAGVCVDLLDPKGD